MTATDRLRSLLDEHGIEWWTDRDIWSGHTQWLNYDEAFTSLAMDGDVLAIQVISRMTPEQAIAATVKPPEDVAEPATDGKTCRIVDNEHGPNMHCTACGGEVDDEYPYFAERYGYSRCPHCGARIETIG